MNSKTINLENGQNVLDLISKDFDYFLIRNFNPNEALEWWITDLKSSKGLVLKNIKVREMEFDIQTNLKGLKKIIDFNTTSLVIYQFDKPISDTFFPKDKDDEDFEKILAYNGLKFKYVINYEFITITKYYDS